jgi:hypothetical protein
LTTDINHQTGDGHGGHSDPHGRTDPQSDLEVSLTGRAFGAWALVGGFIAIFSLLLSNVISSRQY